MSTLTIHVGHTCINTDYSWGTHASALTTHTMHMPTLTTNAGHTCINIDYSCGTHAYQHSPYTQGTRIDTHYTQGTYTYQHSPLTWTLLHQHMPHLCDKQHSPHTQGTLTQSTLLTQKYPNKQTKWAIQNDNRAGERKKETKKEKKKKAPGQSQSG